MVQTVSKLIRIFFNWLISDGIYAKCHSNRDRLLASIWIQTKVCGFIFGTYIMLFLLYTFIIGIIIQ